MAPSRALKTPLWLRLAALVFAAHASAQVLASCVGSRLAATANELATAPGVPMSTAFVPRERPAKSAETILDRNPFHRVADAATSLESRSPRPTAASMAERIHRIGPNEYSVDRRLIGDLANGCALGSSTNGVLFQERGRTVGIRLVGIRPGTWPALLGFRNADVIRSVNGFDMATPDDALAAFARLRSADQLTVEILRDENVVRLDYDMR